MDIIFEIRNTKDISLVGTLWKVWFLLLCLNTWWYGWMSVGVKGQRYSPGYVWTDPVSQQNIRSANWKNYRNTKLLIITYFTCICGWVMLSGHVPVCLSVCVRVCVFLCYCLGYNFWSRWHRKFIFDFDVNCDKVFSEQTHRYTYTPNKNITYPAYS